VLTIGTTSPNDLVIFLISANGNSGPALFSVVPFLRRPETARDIVEVPKLKGGMPTWTCN